MSAEFTKEKVLNMIDSFIRVLNDNFETEKQKAEQSTNGSLQESVYSTSAFKSVGGIHALQTFKDYIKPLKEEK